MYEQFANEVAGLSGLTLSDMDEIACKVIGGGIGYRVRDIAGLTYLPEFIATTQIGSTSRLLGLFIEQYIRLCYNHVMNRDK